MPSFRAGPSISSEPPQFDTFVDPAATTVVTTVAYRPWDDPADTLASRRDSLIRSLAVAAFNRRIERLANAPGSVLLGGGMNDGETKEAALDTSLSIAAKDGAWKDALADQRTGTSPRLDHGFTAAELDLQRTDAIGRLKASVQQANARTSQSLANAILQVVGEEDFVTTPAFRLAYYERVAPTVTPAEVNAAFRNMWSGSAPLIHVSGKQPVDTTALAAAYGDSRKLAVAAPKAQAAVAFGYDNFGPAGKMVEDKTIRRSRHSHDPLRQQCPAQHQAHRFRGRSGQLHDAPGRRPIGNAARSAGAADADFGTFVNRRDGQAFVRRYPHHRRRSCADPGHRRVERCNRRRRIDHGRRSCRCR